MLNYLLIATGIYLAIGVSIATYLVILEKGLGGKKNQKVLNEEIYRMQDDFASKGRFFSYDQVRAMYLLNTAIAVTAFWSVFMIGGALRVQVGNVRIGRIKGDGK